MKVKSESITRNVIANYFGRGWAALMALVFLPIYVASLGFEAYGLIGFFAVLQSMLAVFDFGITETLMRESARHRTGVRSIQSLRDLVRSSELIGAVSNTILVLSVWALAERLANDWVNVHQMKLESVAISIALMGVVIATRLQEGIYRGVLLGLGRQVIINVAFALFATARYVGAIAILHYGSASIVAFFAWQVLMSVVSLIVLGTFANRYLPTSDRKPRFSLESLVSVWRFSAGMAVVAGLSIAMVNLDKLILSGVLALDEFGRYALAAAAAGVLYLFVVPITQGFYPEMVGTYAAGDREALIRLHHASSQLVAAFAGSMAIVLSLFSEPILYVWSGNTELASVISPILAILAAVALVNCLGYIGHNLHVVSGTPSILAVTGAGAVLLTLVVLPTVTNKYGLPGGAFAWFGIAVLQAGILLGLAHRGTLRGEGFRWLTIDTALPLLGAGVIAWLLSCFTPEPEVGGRFLLAIYLVVTALVTIATATLIAPDLRVQVISFLHRRRATY